MTAMRGRLGAAGILTHGGCAHVSVLRVSCFSCLCPPLLELGGDRVIKE